MTNKKLFLTFLVISVLTAFPSLAQPKVDIFEILERTFSTVSAKCEEVLKQVNAAGKDFYAKIQIGDKIKVKYEALLALKEDVMEKVKAGQEAYDELKGKFEEFQNEFNETKGKIEEVYEDTYGKLKESEVGSTVTLQIQLKDLQKQMDERKSLVSENLSSQVSMADQNLSVLHQLYSTAEDDDSKKIIEERISDNEKYKTEKQGLLDNLEKEGGTSTALSDDDEYKKLQEQYAQVEETLRQLQEQMKEKGLSMAKSFLSSMLHKSPEEKTAAHEAAIGKYFLGAEEPLNDTTLRRVKEAREQNLKDSVINGMLLVLKLRNKEAETEEDTERVSNNIASVDYDGTVQKLMNEQQIQRMKLKNENLALEGTILKIKTAQDLMSQGYRVKNPNANPGEINLDNYVLTEKELRDSGFGEKGENK